MPVAKPRQRFIIYCHTSPSGKQYVGQTYKTMRQRWAYHVCAARAGRGCPAFGAAIRKYGPKAFTHEVLDVVTTQEGADAAEKVWIKQKGSRVPHGYNYEGGGTGRKEVHELTREKQRVITIAQWGERTAEQRREIAQRRASSWLERSTPGERREIAHRAAMSRSIEERRAAMAYARAALTPEQRSEKQRQCALNMWAKKSPEERRAIGLRREAAQTIEARRARGLKAWQSRNPESQAEAAQKARETISRVSTETRREFGRRSWITRRENIRLSKKEKG